MKILVFLLLLSIQSAWAQHSAHQEQSLFPPAIQNNALPSVLQAQKNRFPIVYAWLPWWVDKQAVQIIPNGAITHLAAFSLEIDTTNGQLTPPIGMNFGSLQQLCKQKEIAFHLTITCFGKKSLNSFLGDSLKWKKCFQDLAQLNCDGVNIDFEDMPTAQRESFLYFLKTLKASFPLLEITAACPAVDWNNAWDLQSIASICDFIVLMGYDYYWSGSPNAGPVAPLAGEAYTLQKSVETYLKNNVPAQKLVLALPLYGRGWQVNSTSPGAKVKGTGNSRVITWQGAINMPEYQNRTFDPVYACSWFNTVNKDTVYQYWIDDSVSMQYKYNLIASNSLLGVGFWALGYEGGSGSFWNGLMQSGISSIQESIDLAAHSQSAYREGKLYTLQGEFLGRYTTEQLAAFSGPAGPYLYVANGKANGIILP
jgi:spore germination protein YaaH